jgi:hypothetical protein
MELNVHPIVAVLAVETCHPNSSKSHKAQEVANAAKANV